MDMESDNTFVIANDIFTKDPGLVNSIQLQLEDNTIDYATSNSNGVDSFIEEILCNILYHGIKIIFNKNEMFVNIPFTNITKTNFSLLMKLLKPNELQLLQEYTMSFGYKIKFKENLYNGFEKVY